MTKPRLSADLCRSWLFVGGTDRKGLEAVPDCGADAGILEFEDFTAPPERPAARAAAPAILQRWRQAGLLVTARVNPLAGEGRADLAAVMPARPDAILLPKVRGPDDILVLDQAVTAEERRNGIAEGSTRLVPNIESAAALFQTQAIATASPRVVACLLASEDLATDLGAPRTREAGELAFARGFFHAACVAAGKLSIDFPYTFADAEGAAAQAAGAAALGMTAKSLVDPGHARAINAAFTPSPEAVAHARRVVAAFRAARAAGQGWAELEGHLLEVPTLRNAEALLARAEALGAG